MKSGSEMEFLDNILTQNIHKKLYGVSSASHMWIWLDFHNSQISGTCYTKT